jgi:hypothetical protein
MTLELPLNLSEITEFLQSPVAIDVASCSKGGQPSLARGLGCRVLAEGRELCIFLSKARSLLLLGDVENDPRLAAVFCLPSTEQAVQIKGIVTLVRSLTLDEYQILDTKRRAFADEVAILGFSAEFIDCYWHADDCVAIIIKPMEIYEQTPGPLAGCQLSRSLT